jgi:hypothetical protein
MTRRYSRRLSIATVTIAGAILLTTQTGCPAGTDFRDAALPAVRTGVESILDGILDGIFAALEPETAMD